MKPLPLVTSRVLPLPSGSAVAGCVWSFVTSSSTNLRSILKKKMNFGVFLKGLERLKIEKKSCLMGLSVFGILGWSWGF